jgi:hypothetical protein
VRDQVSHPYKTTLLVRTFLDRRLKTECVLQPPVTSSPWAQIFTPVCLTVVFCVALMLLHPGVQSVCPTRTESGAMTQTSRDLTLTMQWFQNTVLPSMSILRTRKYCTGNWGYVRDVITAHWFLRNLFNHFVSNSQKPADPVVAEPEGRRRRYRPHFHSPHILVTHLPHNNPKSYPPFCFSF